MFITYEGRDEIIVTTEELEEEAIRVWFDEGGRDPEEYSRVEIGDEAVCVFATIMVG